MKIVGTLAAGQCDGAIRAHLACEPSTRWTKADFHFMRLKTLWAKQPTFHAKQGTERPYLPGTQMTIYTKKPAYPTIWSSSVIPHLSILECKLVLFE